MFNSTMIVVEQKKRANYYFQFSLQLVQTNPNQEALPFTLSLSFLML